MLNGGHLADLLAGEKGQNGLRPSEVVKDEFAEGGPEFIHRQDHEALDAFGEHLVVLLLGHYFADGLDVLPIQIFGVDALEIVGEDIEDPHFLLVAPEERGDCVVALGLAADEGKDVVDEVGLCILLEVLLLGQLGDLLNAWLVLLEVPFSCIINIMG